MPLIVDPSLAPATIEVYNAIREALIKYQIAPSQPELARAVGCSGTTVVKALSALRKKNYIDHQRYTTRGVTLPDPDLRLSRKSVDPWDEDTDTPAIWG